MTWGKDEWLVGDTLARSATVTPDAPAVEVDGGTYDYATLFDASLRFAGGLRELGLERGGRVVIQSTNSWETAVALYGTTLAGGVFVVVNPQTKSDKLEYMLRDSEAQILVIRAPLLGAFTTIGEPLPQLRHVIVSATDTLQSGFLGFDDVLGGGPASSPREAIATDLA